MEVKIQAQTIAITQQEIKNNIPADVLNEIKQQNEYPYFQAYSIIQDGVSRPKIIGQGYKPIQWAAEVVRGVGGLIKKGVQFFIDHNADNSTSGRKSIGEVIGSFSKRISGKLHQIAIGYFPDKETAKKYDVCSIEADVKMREYPDMNIAEKITDLTGIALGRSGSDVPAFSDAVRVGAIQAFGEGDPEPSDKNKHSKEIAMEINFNDVQKAVRDMNIHPHQLFKDEDLKNDRQFGKIYDEYQKKIDGESDYQKQLKEKEEELSKVKAENIKLTSNSRLENIMPDGLTDKQRTFIQKRFNPEKMEDLSDDGLKKFVEESQGEYKEFASLFGENESNKPDNDSEESTGSDGNEGDADKSNVDKVVGDILK